MSIHAVAVAIVLLRPSLCSKPRWRRTRRPVIFARTLHFVPTTTPVRTVTALSVMMLALGGLHRCSEALADDTAGNFVSATHGDRKYVVFVPSTPPPPQGYPLIFFLHGAGERGTDGQRQLERGLGPAVRRRASSFPGIVVFPQADYADGPILETWRAGEPQGELARRILADVEERWPVDPERRAITGWSMGAYGALSHAAADPRHFSRVLAVAGGGEPQWGPPLATLPVWLIHGADDRIVPPSESRTLASHVPEPHQQLHYTEVPSARHDIDRSVYDDQDVLNWLLSSDAATPPVDDIVTPHPPDSVPRGDQEQQFAPDLIISRAISLRLGNDALQTLAGGVPEALEDGRLRGSLSPVEDTIDYDGQTYDVRFRDMTYQACLERALLNGTNAGLLQVAFALRNFEVRIGTIEVSGATDGVTVSDVSIVIGHRQPVWMHLNVTPVCTDAGVLRLNLHDADFAIGDHNWYVDPPAQIRIRGQQWTNDLVTTAIVGGLYQRKSLIEAKVVGAIDPILRQIEQRIDFAPLSQLVTSLWPLPVYQPQLHVRLEDISTDAGGVSLVFGCEVDDPAQAPRQRPMRVTASTPPAAQIEPVTGLRAAIAVDVVEHLSALLAGTQMMSIYGADIPGRPFEELDDVEGLSQSLRELQGSGSLADVRSRLALNQPFRYRPLRGEDGETSAIEMAIDIPELSLTVFAKENAPEAGWNEVAHRDLVLQQPIRLQARPRLDGPTELMLSWGDEAMISTAVENDKANAPDELVERCRQGWSRWVGLQQRSTTVPDVAVGSSALRLDGFCWQGTCLTAEFQPAATVLINPSSQDVEYCIRSSNSRWSRPLRLAPGRQHIFRSGVPLQVRPAAQWSQSGEQLSPGTYEWTSQADSPDHRWVARRRVASPAPPTALLSP